jgi:prefoldin subunit 5
MSDYENGTEYQRSLVQAKLDEVERQLDELERRRLELQDEIDDLEQAELAA